MVLLCLVLMEFAFAVEPLSISLTISDEMCVGYCKTTLSVSPMQATLLDLEWGRSQKGNLPTQRRTLSLLSQEWESIAAAASASKIDSLPEKAGCPGCTDRGVQSLTITWLERSKTVFFDGGKVLEEAQQLLESLRALEAKMRTTSIDGFLTR